MPPGAIITYDPVSVDYLKHLDSQTVSDSSVLSDILKALGHVPIPIPPLRSERVADGEPVSVQDALSDLVYSGGDTGFAALGLMFSLANFKPNAGLADLGQPVLPLMLSTLSNIDTTLSTISTKLSTINTNILASTSMQVTIKNIMLSELEDIHSRLYTDVVKESYLDPSGLSVACQTARYSIADLGARGQLSVVPLQKTTDGTGLTTTKFAHVPLVSAFIPTTSEFDASSLDGRYRGVPNLPTVYGAEAGPETYEQFVTQDPFNDPWQVPNVATAIVHDQSSQPGYYPSLATLALAKADETSCPPTGSA